MTDAVGIAMIDGALGAREPDADGRYFAPARLHPADRRAAARCR